MTAYTCRYCGSDRWTSDYGDPPIRCAVCDRQPIDEPADDYAEPAIIADETERSPPEGTPT